MHDLLRHVIVYESISETSLIHPIYTPHKLLDFWDLSGITLTQFILVHIFWSAMVNSPVCLFKVLLRNYSPDFTFTKIYGCPLISPFTFFFSHFSLLYYPYFVPISSLFYQIFPSHWYISFLLHPIAAFFVFHILYLCLFFGVKIILGTNRFLHQLLHWFDGAVCNITVQVFMHFIRFLWITYFSLFCWPTNIIFSFIFLSFLPTL